MPRGDNPNSKKALIDNRHKFTSETSQKAIERRTEIQQEQKKISEYMREMLDENKRKTLAGQIIVNMGKKPEWYKLGLMMLGEMPEEKVSVSVDKIDSEETQAMLLELKKNAKKRSNPDSK